MNIVILDGYTLNQGAKWPEIEKLGNVTYYDRTSKDEAATRIGDAEIVILNKITVDKQLLDNCPHIQYIGALATGYNNIDIAYAKEKGIVVTNIPAYSTDSVAQYVFALLLAVTNRVESHSQSVYSGKWQNSADFCYWDYPQIELAGKTLGIVGFGKIGSTVAKIARAFGMKVIVNKRIPVADNQDDGIKYTGIEQLYAHSDYISLNVPLTNETTGFINKESIALMKDGVCIINTARGALVNEAHMAQALETGKVRAFATDVAGVEPITPDNPLLKAKNCIITPHIAWASGEARKRLMDMCAANIEGYLHNKTQNQVN